jgi:hypothetical protein
MTRRETLLWRGSLIVLAGWMALEAWWRWM